MGITNDRGRYYWVKRVPKRYAGIVTGVDGRPVSQVRQCLHTDSKAEAQTKAAQVEAARLAEWEAILAGDGVNARKHFQAARDLAEARGFPYRPIEEVSSGDLVSLIDRVLALAENGRLAATPAVTEAILGTVPDVMPDLNEVLSEYYALTKTRHIKKSDAQRHRWKLPRDRAVKNFLSVVAQKNAAGNQIPLPVNEITRADAVKFRAWWSTRVEEGMKIESANKDLGHLSEIFSTWVELTGNPLSNPFAKLRLDGKDERNTPAFSRSWIIDTLLRDGALDRLNDEARDVFLMTMNTGLRPSEITDAPLEDFAVDQDVPFFRVAPHGRELKVAHTKRDIPLLGVSLDAANRIVARGGIQRYCHKAGSWSATVNKFLDNNSLKETPNHVAYSIRHYVENALLAANVDDRVRADILGHKYDRPRYGDGGGLAGRRAALELIAI